MEWTFKLAPGIKWHDGTPLTAKDVAFTYNTSLKAKAGSNTIGVATPFKGSKAVIDDNSQNCEGIVVVDDQTIKFILDKPNAQILPTSFAQLRLMPAHYFDGIALDQYAKQDVNTKLAIGSGAYRMTDNNGGYPSSWRRTATSSRATAIPVRQGQRLFQSSSTPIRTHSW